MEKIDAPNVFIIINKYNYYTYATDCRKSNACKLTLAKILTLYYFRVIFEG